MKLLLNEIAIATKCDKLNVVQQLILDLCSYKVSYALSTRLYKTIIVVKVTQNINGGK